MDWDGEFMPLPTHLSYQSDGVADGGTGAAQPPRPVAESVQVPLPFWGSRSGSVGTLAWPPLWHDWTSGTPSFEHH